MIFTRKVSFTGGRRRAKRVSTEEGMSPRTPRVAKLMALAIHLDQLIREGVIKDQAEAARLSRVTRARMSQILSLTNLAPDIQEEILLLPPTTAGRPMLAELHLRPIAATCIWREQRRLWKALYSNKDLLETE